MRQIRTPEIGEVMQCSVCGKTFKVNDDTKYIINGGYTCSWQCFLKCHYERENLRKEKKK